MKKTLLALCATLSAWLSPLVAQAPIDYSRVSAYVTPYYSPNGPAVSVGRFSSGLATRSEEELLATISKMRKDWDRLTFPELYVASIRLYDFGYRKEAVYWFYTAQARARLFSAVLERGQMGGIGAPGFELLQAHNSFYQLVGAYINGYALGDPDALAKVLEKVQKEAREVPDLEALYPNVAFKKKNEWKAASAELADGMGKLMATLKEKKDEVKQQRLAQHLDETFSKLPNKEFPTR